MNESSYEVTGAAFKKNDIDENGVVVNVAEISKSHERLSHYGNLMALKAMLNNKTFLATRLDSLKLNDTFEANRKNLEKFTGSFFITCFTHTAYEVVPFWMNYGGRKKSEKLMFRFVNFASRFRDLLNTDYCLTSSEGKLFYKIDEWGETSNRNSESGEAFGESTINMDFDTRAFVGQVTLCDVEYRPVLDEVFTRDYKTTEGVLPSYNVANLGRYKTVHWTHEKETRIIVHLNPPEQKYYDHICIVLDQSIFHGLEIVLSPWVTKEVDSQVREIVNTADISKEIKESINIIYSELYGQIRQDKK